MKQYIVEAFIDAKWIDMFPDKKLSGETVQQPINVSVKMSIYQ